MKKLMNLLRGYVELQVTGAFPERLLNLCAQERLQFWRLQWLDGTSFTFRVALRDRRRLEELAARAMCDLAERGRRGAPVMAMRLSHRWGFLLGLALCIAAVSFLSRFLLVIEVTGNDKVPTAAILSELQRLGVRPGAYGPGIEERETANEALLALPDLAYMAINIYGTRAEVVVREAVRVPELLDEDTPADVVADVDGIIIDIQATTGRAMVADGAIVARGDLLIAGDMDLREPAGSSLDLGYLRVRAAGTVTARTWRTLEESAPLTVGEKRYTGEERTLRTAQILWAQVNFFRNSSIPGGRYDKITKIEPLTLFGRTMPASLATVTLREYELEETPIDQEETAARLEAVLLARLEALLEPREGEILQTDFVTRIEDGRLTVTLTAECREQIGETVERDGETGRVGGPGETG